jgi:ribonuclease G
MYAYLTKGNIFRSKKWKWRWKYKQSVKIKSNTNYHLTEFHFFDKNEDEIKL